MRIQYPWKDHELFAQCESKHLDMAYYLLSEIDPSQMSDEDKAHYVRASILLSKEHRLSPEEVSRLLNDERSLCKLLQLDVLIANLVDMFKKHGLDVPNADSYVNYISTALSSNVRTTVRERGYFIEHCDDPSCGLGTFETICLHCNRPLIDYSVWWKRDDVLKGELQEISCYRCENTLVIHLDKEVWIKRVDDALATYSDINMKALRKAPLPRR